MPAHVWVGGDEVGGQAWESVHVVIQKEKGSMFLMDKGFGEHVLLRFK
jgi:hypothetical protein